MSTPHKDPLYTIFEEHLHSGLYDDLPIEKFLTDVVEFYFHSIQKNGHIPHKMANLIRADLLQDVHDMLRAKIYGHHGIGDYNRLRSQRSS